MDPTQNNRVRLIVKLNKVINQMLNIQVPRQDNRPVPLLSSQERAGAAHLH